MGTQTQTQTQSDSKANGFLAAERSILESDDPQIAALFAQEAQRLEHGLELIASENVASPAVLAALSSVFSNKYAEGYPGKRYYGGCENVDAAEELARDRLKRLFGAEHANVQPHSGAQANQAVFLSCLKPGDAILGMNLSHGGHLTHGFALNSSGMLYRPAFYGVNEQTGFIDYDDVRKAALAHRPALVIAGASAYPRVIDFAAFRSIADEVGARLLVDMAHIAGLVAAGLHPSPVPHAHYVTSTTHKTLRGPRGGVILCGAEFAKDIDRAVFPGTQGGPLMHVVAAKAVAFGEALKPEFRFYMESVAANSRVLASMLMERGLTLVSGGSDNHLILIDLRQSPFSGQDAENRLAEIELTVNKNTVPGETRKAMVTSGIRIGTPAITTRGLGVDDMAVLGNAIADCLLDVADWKSRGVRAVAGLCEKYPLYSGSLGTRGYLTHALP
jgi:glycine hydroxymethyltransferase